VKAKPIRPPVRDGMQVAIYARVSTEDQHCDMQLIDLRRYADRMDWQATEYIEKESSVKYRPVFERMLKDAQAGKFKAILVWRVDRFARSMKDFVFTIEQLNAWKVRLISTTENVDTGDQNPFAEFQRGLLALLAQLERKIIITRVRAGMAAAKAKGIQCGRPRVLVDKSRIRTLHVEQGLSCARIAKMLEISTMTVFRALKK
jgi:DNA invertase Pin-like site-specific DNA recombinase